MTIFQSVARPRQGIAKRRSKRVGFITGGEGLFNPVIIVILAVALYLLWVARKQFLALLN
jgi:hypothetical protein